MANWRGGRATSGTRQGRFGKAGLDGVLDGSANAGEERQVGAEPARRQATLNRAARHGEQLAGSGRRTNGRRRNFANRNGIVPRGTDLNHRNLTNRTGHALQGTLAQFFGGGGDKPQTLRRAVRARPFCREAGERWTDV